MVWRYARPVAMLVAKLEYRIADGDPRIIHACALGWHWLTGLLVYGLATRAGLSRKWAFLAGVIFLIHPHSVFTVGWTAARNALVGGCFFAAAVLAYTWASLDRRTRSVIGRCVRLAIPVLLWGLSLFSRETAVVFPIVVLMLDVSFGGWRHLWRRMPLHLLLWVMTAGFLYWRLNYFDVGEAPAVYFSKPDGLAGIPEYLPWAASKLLQLVFSMVFYTPMLMGLATYEGLPKEIVAVHAIMGTLTGLVAIWYVWASRGHRGRWLWPLWGIAALLPVIPVFAMPQFSYLPAIPYAIMLAILLSRVPIFRRSTITIVIVAATVWSLGVYRFAWWGVIRSEQVVYEDIRSTTVRPEPGSKLFFINHPIAAIYAPDALREAWGFEDLEGYVLTFAPHPLGMRTPSIVKQLSDYEIEVSAPAPGYFSGMPGRMLLNGTRPDSPLTAGTVVEGKGYPFKTTIIEADDAGVRKLKFTFHERLDSDDYCFYVSSPERPAYRLSFHDLRLAPETADADLFARARSDNLLERTSARMEIRRLALPIAVQTAAAVQDDLHLDSDDALARVEEWWRSVDVRWLTDKTQRWRESNAGMLRQREYYFRIMDVVQRCVKSDLFLTGG